MSRPGWGRRFRSARSAPGPANAPQGATEGELPPPDQDSTVKRPVIEVVRVSKRFRDEVVLDNVSLEVQPGETVCILGPSGAGKTTLLRCLNHLEKPSAGAVFVNGELLGYERRGEYLHELPGHVIARQRRSIGMLFQHFHLFSHMTVLENIIEAPKGVSQGTRAELVDEAKSLLASVGLSDKASSMPDELSGGQQQRVAIARALAMKPKVMLLDEPTSALDPELVSEVLDVIGKLTQAGMTTVIVTHEVGFAREVAHRAIFMDEGRIVETVSAAALLTDAQHQRTKEFLSKVL